MYNLFGGYINTNTKPSKANLRVAERQGWSKARLARWEWREGEREEAAAARVANRVANRANNPANKSSTTKEAKNTKRPEAANNAPNRKTTQKVLSPKKQAYKRAFKNAVKSTVTKRMFRELGKKYNARNTGWWSKQKDYTNANPGTPEYDKNKTKKIQRYLTFKKKLAKKKVFPNAINFSSTVSELVDGYNSNTAKTKKKRYRNILSGKPAEGGIGFNRPGTKKKEAQMLRFLLGKGLKGLKRPYNHGGNKLYGDAGSRYMSRANKLLKAKRTGPPPTTTKDILKYQKMKHKKALELYEKSKKKWEVDKLPEEERKGVSTYDTYQNLISE